MARRDELTLDSELIRLLDADPFQVFAMSLTSGERLNVETPDHLIVGDHVATLLGPAGGSVVIRKNQIVAHDATIIRQRQ